jgi:hypothetical protein
MSDNEIVIYRGYGQLRFRGPSSTLHLGLRMEHVILMTAPLYFGHQNMPYVIVVSPHVIGVLLLVFC